jgi:predicted Fe-S protein YdhL (DUF1289 family)
MDRPPAPTPVPVPRLDRAQGIGPVPSPCVSVCHMDADSGLCEGCSRTVGEIAGWGTMADDTKRAVWALIARRRDARAD